MSQLALLGGTPVRTQPFPKWPISGEREAELVSEVARSGNWWSAQVDANDRPEVASPGPGNRVAEIQIRFARFQGARFGVACSGGTSALETALRACGVGPGDEVILPPYTFISSASAVLTVNAIPIFADVDPVTFNLSPDATEAAITPRTRAILPVHFSGHAADMDRFLAMGKSRGLKIIEDACHGHGAKWKGQGLGSLGDAAAFSFQASKNLTCGDGGMMLTSDEEVNRTALSLVWYGRQKRTPWYQHHILGGNSHLTEFQASILLAQLERLPGQVELRTRHAEVLRRELGRIPGIHPLPVDPRVTVHSYHLFMIRYRAEELGGLPREKFLAALAKEGIPASAGYGHPLYKAPVFLNREFYKGGCPLTCSAYGRAIDYASFEARCPESERACREAIWMTQNVLLGTDRDMEDVVAGFQKVAGHAEALRSYDIPPAR
ncbi:MAG: DegT/DnrJ/EryC1/StrS family aminotransferase [Planctomycetes bacterium]|nr:DegT/DnrJ/EryC1/StrS family aminotransferase [Planctomycetota bacterium]